MRIVRKFTWHVLCFSSGTTCFPENEMLWTTFVTILMLWCLGIVTAFTLSGFIHVLPFMAAVVAVIGTIQSRGLL